MEQADPFRILAVCTGNVCRSPMVERLLQSGLDRLSPDAFEVRSAGTQALVGEAMTPQVAGLVRVLGADDSNFTSRQLTPSVLGGQNLVLALTRQHRSRILELAPALLRRTFTLREFGRMVNFVASDETADYSWPGDVYSRWEQLIPAAAATRHETMALRADDDVVDPYRKDDAVHQQMVEQISPAVEALLKFEESALTRTHSGK